MPETEERKGTVPSRLRAESNTDETSAAESKPLRPSELKKLKAQGYGKPQIAKLSPDQAREIIQAKTLRPGSAAARKASPNPLNGHTASSPLPSVYAEDAPAGNGVVARSSVIVSEYTGRLIKGNDPLDALLIEYAEANPGKRFRLINPDLPTVAGPQWDPITDDAGKLVTEGGMILGWMPEEVYQDAYVKPNLERSANQMQKIKKAARDVLQEDGGVRAVEDEDAGVSLRDNDPYAPMRQDSIQVRRSDTVYSS
jgi:hypothetical protein